MIFLKKTNNLAQAFTVKQEEINEFMTSQQKVWSMIVWPFACI